MRQISTLFLVICMCIGAIGCDGEKPASEGPELVDPNAASDSSAGSGKRSSGSEKKEDDTESEGDSE